MVQFSFSRTSAMPLANRSSATDPFTDCDRMVEGRGHGRVGRRRAHIRQRLGFGQRDLALGVLVRPRDEILHLGLGFGRDALGFGFCGCDDVLGFAFRGGVTGLVFRQQFGGLVLEAAGVVEFGLMRSLR